MIISFLFDLNRKYHEPKYTNYHKYQVSDVYKMKSMLIQSWYIETDYKVYEH